MKDFKENELIEYLTKFRSFPAEYYRKAVEKAEKEGKLFVKDSVKKDIIDAAIKANSIGQNYGDNAIVNVAKGVAYDYKQKKELKNVKEDVKNPKHRNFNDMSKEELVEFDISNIWRARNGSVNERFIILASDSIELQQPPLNNLAYEFQPRLYRLIAIRDFVTASGKEVKAGDLGGYITQDAESFQFGQPELLSSVVGNSWVEDGCIFATNSSSLMLGSALLEDGTRCYGNGIRLENSIISGSEIFYERYDFDNKLEILSTTILADGNKIFINAERDAKIVKSDLGGEGEIYVSGEFKIMESTFYADMEQKINLGDVLVVKSDIVGNAEINESNLESVKSDGSLNVKKSKIKNLQNLGKTKIGNSDILNSQVDDANISSSSLNRSELKKCEILNSDIYGCKMVKTNVQDSKLNQSEIGGSNIQNSQSVANVHIDGWEYGDNIIKNSQIPVSFYGGPGLVMIDGKEHEKSKIETKEYQNTKQAISEEQKSIDVLIKR